MNKFSYVFLYSNFFSSLLSVPVLGINILLQKHLHFLYIHMCVYVQNRKFLIVKCVSMKSSRETDLNKKKVTDLLVYPTQMPYYIHLCV